MTIYIITGTLKGLDDGFVEVLKAFTLRENADKYCSDLLEKPDNPYREVNWQQTELEL